MQAGIDDILDVRFLLLLMGFFALYCGFIYNDFLSMPWNLFGTCWKHKEPGSHEVVPVADCIYPIGFRNNLIKYKTNHQICRIGPFMVYRIKRIELLQFIENETCCDNRCCPNDCRLFSLFSHNTYKFYLGIYLKGMNTFHFSEPIDFIFEVIPQMAFMICTFGYFSNFLSHFP